MPLFQVDFHSHCQGDGIDRLEHTAREHVDRAVETGLHAIAITWHRKIFDRTDIMDYARERGLLLIPGIEAEIRGAHTLVLNVTPGDVQPRTSVAALNELRRNPEIFIIAPHPYYPHPTCLGRLLDEHPDTFDGVEWCFYHFPWIPDAINPNLRAKAWAERHGKPLIATSDAHDLQRLGRIYSVVDAEELSAPAILDALRHRRVSFTPHVFTAAELFWLNAGIFWAQSRYAADRTVDLWERVTARNRSAAGGPKKP